MLDERISNAMRNSGLHQPEVDHIVLASRTFWNGAAGVGDIEGNVGREMSRR